MKGSCRTHISISRKMRPKMDGSGASRGISQILGVIHGPGLRVRLRSSVYPTTVLQELTWDVPNTIHIKWIAKIRD
jgi:hypothetical protein